MTENNNRKRFNSEDLLELIKERRSVRIFTGDKVPKEKIMKIIEAGIWAPTGCNNQELKFLIIDNEKGLNDVLEFKPFLRGVSTVVLIFCDMALPMSHTMYIQYRHERHLPYVDTGLSLSHMILYAKSLGIDSCIVNLSAYHFKRSRGAKNFIIKIIDKCKRGLNLHASIKNNLEYYLRNTINMPEHLKIMCGVAFGYAKIYPAVQKMMHGGRKVMRDKVENYVVEQNNSRYQGNKK